MSITIPLGVEKYLLEMGLTLPEITVLKKLLEAPHLTLREIAAETNKGNGITDASLKKLMQRGIVEIEKVNGRPKYRVRNPDVIVAWTQKNLKENVDILQRKHQSFTQFISTISTASNRPELEHFSGQEGFMKAYDKLLQYRTELLTYFGPSISIDNDPLADFRAQYARRRQVHGIFQRIIAPDSPVARRFRTRDPFEYRHTVLIKPADYPVSFEKIIAGSIVACLDSETMEGSCLQFDKLAASERSTFERLWNEQIALDRSESDTPPVKRADTPISIWQQPVIINAWQRRSLFALAFLSVAWLMVTFQHTTTGFYNYLYSLLFGLVPLISGIMGMWNAKLWGGWKTSIGRGVFFVGLGIFLWATGSMVWAYYNFVLHMPSPYPSLADICYAPSVFFYGLGVICLSDATGAKMGLRNMYAKIFIVLAPIAILCLSYYAFVVVGRGGVLVSPGGSMLKMILDFAYPLGDFLGLTIAVLISGLSFPRIAGMYVLNIFALLAGLIVMFIGDFVFTYTNTIGTFYNGSIGDLIFTIGTFLLSFGVLGFCETREDKQRMASQVSMPASPSCTADPLEDLSIEFLVA